MSTPEKDFAALSFGVFGDFFQLPPVKAQSLFSSMWKTFGLGHKTTSDGTETPLSRGTHLFGKLKKFELLQQMRAAEDPVHTAMLDEMRFPGANPRMNRINRQHIKSLRTITKEDFSSTPHWLQASLVVTSNKERHLINQLRSRHWARHSGNKRFTWKYPLCGFLAAKAQTPAHNYIYANYPEFSGCFVAGAPGI